MQREDDELPRGRSPFGTVPFVALCLFIGFWGFVYDGYSEDAGSGQADTAWIGVVAFAVAGLSILRAVRRMLPGKRVRVMVVTPLLAVALAGLAVGATYIYAGNQ